MRIEKGWVIITPAHARMRARMHADAGDQVRETERETKQNVLRMTIFTPRGFGLRTASLMQGTTHTKSSQTPTNPSSSIHPSIWIHQDPLV